MKAISSVVFCLLVAALTVHAQSRYAVEFIGGMKFNGILEPPSIGRTNGVCAGLGASMYLGKYTELVGSTLFTYYPPSNVRSAYTIIPAPASQADDGQYSTEISVGMRFHGHGSQFIHPYLIMQGGMMFRRFSMVQDAWVMPSVAATQFLNIHGTEDIQTLGAVNVGVGLQFSPVESLLLNFEAKYQMLLGPASSVETFIPVVISLQLPM